MDRLEDRRLLDADSFGAGETIEPSESPLIVLTDTLETREWILQLPLPTSEEPTAESAQLYAVDQLAQVTGDFPGPAAAPFSISRHLGGDYYLVTTDPRYSAAHVRSTLRALPNSRPVEPNQTFAATESIPTDPQFFRQWSLHNTGQTGGTPDADIDAPAAWDITTGNSDTIVAVFDSGIDYSHPDLVDQLWRNTSEVPANGLDDDSNGYVDDIFGIDTIEHDADPRDQFGHGSHVAGTIAARWANDVGVVGVAPNVSLMTLRILNSTGSGNLAAAVEAIQYMIMMRRDHGVNIVVGNHSWGGSLTSPALEASFAEAIDAGILMVAAAGNRTANVDSQPFYPASLQLDGIISVGSSDHNDHLAANSNYGQIGVDLLAPGVGIYSTEHNGGYGIRNGTSMATPHVSGAAALIKSIYPLASPTQLARALLSGVDLIPAAANKTVSGGRLNLQHALTAMELVAVSVSPDDRSVTSQTPTDFEIAFSQDIVATGLEPHDFAVNGVPADQVQLVSARAVRYSFSQTPVTQQGIQHITLAAGAVSATPGGLLQEEFRASFRYDAVPLTVSSTTPPGNTAATLPITQLVLDWNEPIDPASISSSDLRLSTGVVVSVAQGPQNRLVFGLAGVATEETLTWHVPSGALRDLFGNNSVLSAGEMPLDFGVVPLPAPWTILATQTFAQEQSTWNGTLGASDIDEFLISVDGDQPLSVEVTFAPTLTMRAELVMPDGNLATFPLLAPAANRIIVQGITRSEGGTYRLRILSEQGTSGDYNVTVRVGGTLELEQAGQYNNDVRLSSEPIENGMASTGNDSHMAIRLGIADDIDWYQLNLSAGDTIGVQVDGPAAVDLLLTLVDGQGATITTLPAGNSGMIELDAYQSAIDEPIFLQLSGVTDGRTYRLHVQRNLPVESHDATAAQRRSLNGRPKVLGSLGTISSSSANSGGSLTELDLLDGYAIELQVGSPIRLTTRTPAGEPAFPHAPSNALDPMITVWRPDGFQIGRNDNGAADGKNATLEFTPNLTGTYRIDIAAVRGSGSYLLEIDGVPATTPSLSVIRSEPAAGATVVPSASPHITIDFSAPIDLRTVQPGDLRVDGIVAQSVTAEEPHRLRFDFSAPFAAGLHVALLNGNVLRSLTGLTNVPWQSSFAIDNTAPRVTGLQAVDLGNDTEGRVQVTIDFDEPLRIPGDLAEAVQLVGAVRGPIIPESMVYDAEHQSLTVVTGSLMEDRYTLRLLSSDGGWEDLAGNKLDGEANGAGQFPTGNGIAGGDFVWHWSVDQLFERIGNLSRVAPLGSGLTAFRSAVGAIESSSDIDHFQWDPWAATPIVIAVRPLNAAASLAVETHGELFSSSQAGGVIVIHEPGQMIGTGSITIQSNHATAYTLEIYQGLESYRQADPQSSRMVTPSPLAGGTRHVRAGGTFLGVSEESPVTERMVIDLTDMVGESFDVMTVWHSNDGNLTGESDVVTVEIRGPQGELVARADETRPLEDGGTALRLTQPIVIVEPGNYTVSIISHRDGTFVVWGLLGASAEQTGAIESAGRLNTGPSMAGFVATEHDEYQVDLIAGQTVQFDLSGWTASQTADLAPQIRPQLLLLDGRGEIVAATSATQSTAAALQFTAARDDHYRLEVFTTSGVGEYLLRTQFGSASGDFSGDHYLDCVDLLLLEQAVAAGAVAPNWDINADGNVDQRDIVAWIVTRKGTGLADANLDFVVDGSDWNIWLNHRFTINASWCDGDFNGDGSVDGMDATIWQEHRFTTAR